MLVLVLVVTATPVEQVFQSFHLFNTTQSQVAARYVPCVLCTRLLGLAMSSRRLAAGLPGPAFTQRLLKCQGRAETRGRSALDSKKSLVCQVTVTLAEVSHML